MVEPRRPLLFILGSERSCSTWLGNIFDAHAGVEFWMEPFAEYAGFFPGFPGRNNHLAAGDPTLIELVDQGWNQLHRAKYPRCYQPGRPLFAKGLDRFLLGGCRRLCRLLHCRTPLAVDRYHLLNLNQARLPLSRHGCKLAAPTMTVVKELRLNFKVPFLAAAFPGARYLIPIRHPGAQISSIIRLFGRGGLGELAASLPACHQATTQEKRFAKYREITADPGAGANPTNQLINWWLLNNTVLLEDLIAGDLPYLLVPNEEISAAPARQTDCIFAFAGARPDAGVADFLAYSTTAAGHSSSPVDTVRASAEYYKNAIKAVAADLTGEILQAVGKWRQAGLLPGPLAVYLKNQGF